MKAALLCLIVVSVSAWGIPTNRILPPGAHSNADFTLLRDHADEQVFHLLPKRYEVLENTLVPLAEGGADCKSVDEYTETFHTALKAKQTLLAAELRIAERIEAMIANASEVRRQLQEAQIKKHQAEDKVAEGTAETLEVDKAEALVQKLTQRLAVVEKPLSQTSLEQDKVLSNIKSLESSISEFRDELIRPAARAHIRLRLPGVDTASPELKVQLGLAASAKLRLAPVIGVDLFPLRDEEGDYRDKLKKASEIGYFSPEWSIKPLEFSPSSASRSELIKSAAVTHVEREISFENIFSLYSYCSLKKVSNPKAKLVTPLRITYTVAVWSSALLKTVETSLCVHRRTLDAEAWKRFSLLKSLPPAKPAEIVDLGAPSLFSPQGQLEPYPHSVSFSLSQSNNGGLE